MKTFNMKLFMRKIKIVVTCLVCWGVCVAGLQAQNIESVELCDGSLLEGYISEQSPGKSMLFSACRATIVIPSKAVASIVEHNVAYASLSSDWKRWADEFAKGKKDLVLSDIRLVSELKVTNEEADTLQDKQKALPEYLSTPPYKVRVLEKGTVIKYLDLTPQVFRLKWSDVKCIYHSRRPGLAMSGLNSVICLKGSGDEYRGEIVEQLVGKQIRLLKSDGVIEVIDANQMTSIRKEKLNPEQDLFEQTPLLDQVYTRTGNMITGIIVEQNLVSTKEKPAFFTVQNRDGGTRVVAYSDVEKYGRCVNSDYKLLTDIVLDDTTVMVNRQKALYTSFEQDEEGFLYAKDLDKVMRFAMDSLEAKRFMIMELKDRVDANDYALMRVVEKRGKLKKNEQVKNGFTYESFAMYSTRSVEQTVSVNGTRKVKYSVGTPGWYVLYLPKQRKGILCHIK